MPLAWLNASLRRPSYWGLERRRRRFWPSKYWRKWRKAGECRGGLNSRSMMRRGLSSAANCAGESSVKCRISIGSHPWRWIKMNKCPFCQFENETGATFCEQCKSDIGADLTHRSGAGMIAPDAPMAAVVDDLQAHADWEVAELLANDESPIQFLGTVAP